MTETGSFTNSATGMTNHKRGCQYWATKVAYWFPPVFVAGIAIYSYYVYVIEFCCTAYNIYVVLRDRLVLTLLEYDPPLVLKAGTTLV